MSSSPNPPIPPRNSSSKGSGGLVIALLAVLSIGLAIFSIALWNKQDALKQDATKLTEDLKKETALKVAAEGRAANLDGQLSRAIPITRLPTGMGITNPLQAIAEIERLYKASLGTPAADPGTPGSGGPTPVPGGAPRPGVDPAIAVALENVSKAVTSKAFDAKAPVAATDTARLTLHRQIQAVLTKVGSYNKPISGNQKDTLEAVMAFQKANGLKADGIIGKGTWGKVREKYEAAIRAGN